MPRYESRYGPAMMPQNLEHVLYEKKEHVAYVTINRPEVRNALHTYAYAELRSCWLDIARDPDIYVGIVTGAGDAFCAGRDVKFLSEHQAKGIRTPHEDPTNPMYSWGGGGQPKDVQLEKPLISAINGYAVGVGLSIALQCQLRVMADDAWLGDLHTQVGRMGGAHRLYMAVPRAIAAELTLCNARLTAERCYQLGIVNAVVPKDQLIPAAEKLAETGLQRLAAGSAGGGPALQPVLGVLARDVGAGPPPRPGNRGDRGRRGRPARLQGEAQAAVEAALRGAPPTRLS